MKAADYSKKISLENKLELYNKLSDILMEYYPFQSDEESVLQPIQDSIEERIEDLNKKYVLLMDKSK